MKGAFFSQSLFRLFLRALINFASNQIVPSYSLTICITPSFDLQYPANLDSYDTRSQV